MNRYAFWGALVLGLASVGSLHAQTTTVYSSTTTGALAGYGEANTSNPIFGDQLVLSQGGLLNSISFTVFNPGASAGAMLTANVTISVFNNTTPYTSGPITNPLLGSIVFGLNFGAGLNPGFFGTLTGSLLSLNITAPTNILVTQRFNLLTGAATQNGVVLFNNSLIGSSPNNVFVSSTGTPAGLYTFGGGAANSQFGYALTISVPEPATVMLGAAGCAVAIGLLIRRRRLVRTQFESKLSSFTNPN